MSKKILVTGGFGYVGSRLTPLLLDKGYTVRVLDLCLYGDYGLEALKRDPEYQNWADRFELIRGDIRDPETVRKSVEGMDSVIHLAAISNDPTGNINETVTRQVNFDAVGLLVSVAKEEGLERFINASSSSVFGVKEVENVTESLEPEPITFYSKYKMLSEWVVVSASSREFCTVNVRPATVCGFSPRQRFDLTVNKLTADAIRKRVITVHGGQQRRPNVGMTDMIHLYASLLETDPKKINGKTFNFGFENQRILEIAQMIQAELADLDVSIRVEDVFDNRDYHISSDKVLNEIGYRPVSSIRQEVQNLRNALETCYPDIDAPQFYNMKTMKLNQNSDPYRYLSR